MKMFWKIIGLFILLLGIFLSILLVWNHYTYEFHYTDGEPNGDKVTSPTGAYTAKAYYQYYGGAAGGVNLWVNVTFHEEEDREETIYFSRAGSTFFVNWVDDKTIFITNQGPSSNRSAKLVVGEEIYDEDGGACGTYKTKKNYICFDKNFKVSEKVN